MTAPSPQVIAAVDELNLYLHSHGGSVRLVEEQGSTVRLRYDGMCAGCMFRPLTTQATLRPMMRDRFGLEVEVVGSRVSAEAEERLAKAMSGSGSGSGSWTCPLPAHGEEVS